MKRNFKPMKVLRAANGTWLIKMRYFKKDVTCVVTNAEAIADYMCDKNERCSIDGRTYRKTRGYEYLLNQIRKQYDKVHRPH